MPAAYVDENGNFIRRNVKGQAIDILTVQQIKNAADNSIGTRDFMRKLNYPNTIKTPSKSLILYCEQNNIKIPFYVMKGGPAEQKVDPITGELKWFKTCSKLKKVFSADTKEGLSKYFPTTKNPTSDGFTSWSKEAKSQSMKKYFSTNKERWDKYQKEYRQKPEYKIKQKDKNKNYRIKNGEKLYLYSKSPQRFLSKYKFLAAKNGIEFNLNLEWFENEMNSPRFNICSITNVKFVDEHNHLNSRCLLRIDNNKPFEDGNVRWVCLRFATPNSISKPSQKWLDYLGIPNIIGETREVLFKLGNKKVVVDGYDPQTNTVYEFHGDYWHGNPAIYNLNEINKVVNKTFGELLQKTQKRSRLIKSHGYNLVSIWESDWENIKRSP